MLGSTATPMPSYTNRTRWRVYILNLGFALLVMEFIQVGLANAHGGLIQKSKLIESQIIEGDCLIEMSKLPAESVAMVLSDLPYEITQNHWDSMLPLDKLWTEFKRLIKDSGVIVLTAAQPFTSALVNSNPEMFKYVWYWKKGNKPTNYLNAHKQPLRIIEEIAVFYNEQCTYNPQMGGKGRDGAGDILNGKQYHELPIYQNTVS